MLKRAGNKTKNNHGKSYLGWVSIKEIKLSEWCSAKIRIIHSIQFEFNQIKPHQTLHRHTRIQYIEEF